MHRKSSAPWLIVGLGNPGPKYAGNRHNVGFHTVERLATEYGLRFAKRQKRAHLALGQVRDRRVILAKPRTFMNKSGQAVVPLMRFYRVPIQQVLVVYDDLDLPLGTLRMRPGGGAGGHNGMRSIIGQLGDRDFSRLRIGIGRPPGRMDPAAYVLQDFSAAEAVLIDEVLDQAVAAIKTWLVAGIDMAMTHHNRDM